MKYEFSLKKYYLYTTVQEHIYWVKHVKMAKFLWNANESTQLQFQLYYQTSEVCLGEGMGRKEQWVQTQLEKSKTTTKEEPVVFQ